MHRKNKKHNIMKVLNQLDIELCESAISHILNRFSKRSRPIRDTDYRIADGICLLPCELEALSHLHELLNTAIDG